MSDFAMDIAAERRLALLHQVGGPKAWIDLIG
jgi:hypothetical protein